MVVGNRAPMGWFINIDNCIGNLFSDKITNEITIN